jgi:hypothetical protein
MTVHTALCIVDIRREDKRRRYSGVKIAKRMQIRTKGLNLFGLCGAVFATTQMPLEAPAIGIIERVPDLPQHHLLRVCAPHRSSLVAAMPP